MKVRDLSFEEVEKFKYLGATVTNSRGEESAVEWSGVEWSGVEWSGVEWSGVEWRGEWSRVSGGRVESSGVEWSGVEESGVEWSRVEWRGEWSRVESSGVERRVESSGVEWSGEESGVEWSGEESGESGVREWSGEESGVEWSGVEWVGGGGRGGRRRGGGGGRRGGRERGRGRREERRGEERRGEERRGEERRGEERRGEERRETDSDNESGDVCGSATSTRGVERKIRKSSWKKENAQKKRNSDKFSHLDQQRLFSGFWSIGEKQLQDTMLLGYIEKKKYLSVTQGNLHLEEIRDVIVVHRSGEIRNTLNGTRRGGEEFRLGPTGGPWGNLPKKE
ncbi:hypothetical protein ANN_16812 [Periplaneta americana]|uniref:Uncharacterized protein n=1 Tax=Periplaneta americana TaxID=6978 RepID=A0ABQ8SSH7_PERAM|nr:hypothetical protein ANN_16812 [Periplaneta americana]